MQDRMWIFKSITVVVTLVVIAVGLDLLLRARPTLFGQHLGNYVFSRYGLGPGDLYFRVPGLDAWMMWPNFETRAYYNGWFWNHRTDDRGFRNPPDRESDVLLLGDSLIYGHGAEQEDLVSEVLHDRFGWETYNLGQQGDGLYQSYAKLRLFQEELAPRFIIHFAFANDVGDLEVVRSTEEIESLPELTRDDWGELRETIAEVGQAGGRSGWLSGQPVVRFPGGVLQEITERRQRAARSDAEGPFAALLDAERRAAAQRYYDLVLTDMAARAGDAGAELIIVNLDVTAGLDPDVRRNFRELVEHAARVSGAHYYDTGGVISSCLDCILENDGHLNAKGHMVLAELVDGWLREVHPGAATAH